MRFYCHNCGRVTSFNSLSPTAISCEKCNHQQPINNMATRKTGSVTGANLDRKTGKGKLTNSSRFDPPDVDTPISATTSTTTATQTPTSARTNGSGGNIRARSSNGSSGSLAVSDHSTTYKKALDLASKYGIQPLDIGSLLGSDPYQADGSLPEMSAADANKIKLKIQRQSNAIEVRHEKTKLGRKIMKAATEEVGLIGDTVDYATAEINVATKIVKHEIALTHFDIEQSKLTQTQELLIQQNIATDGTIALTDGIRDEWILKVEKQSIRNGGIKIEIETSMLDNDRKREEMEARLISAS